MLFIDANGYIEFYNSSHGSIKKLLPSLCEIKDEIFITQQIVYEVKRNRLSVVSNNLNSYLNSCKLNGIRLPEHLDAVADDEINEWNKAFSESVAKVVKEKESLQSLVDKTVLNVQSGNDAVSNALNEIFSNAVAPSNEEIDRARTRKEVGNPPGKKADPLGDQISWEQLLSNFNGETPLWIISADGDYSSHIDKQRYLNAFLYEELCEKAGKQVEVHVFDSIARGVKHYSDNRPTPVQTLPSEEDLRQITSQEDLNKVAYTSSNVFPDPIACFGCGESKGFSGPIPRPSQYGGWTYQWMCKACGKFHDFGEPYEE